MVTTNLFTDLSWVRHLKAAKRLHFDGLVRHVASLG